MLRVWLYGSCGVRSQRIVQDKSATQYRDNNVGHNTANRSFRKDNSKAEDIFFPSLLQMIGQVIGLSNCFTVASVMMLFIGCLSSQQRANVSQGRMLRQL